MKGAWHEWTWTGPVGWAPPLAALRERIEAAGATVGRIRVTPPATALFTGDPVWQASGPRALIEAVTRAAAAADLGPPRPLPGPAQVYRVLDEAGRFGRDVVRGLDEDPVSGQLLLTDAWAGGRWCLPEDMDERGARVLDRQKAALPADPQSYPVVDERRRCSR